MIDPEDVLKARLNWVLFYEQTHNIDLTCRRCGISRPTLRKWWTRYLAEVDPVPSRRGSWLVLTQPTSSQVARA
jgi:transposase-like protein